MAEVRFVTKQAEHSTIKMTLMGYPDKCLELAHETCGLILGSRPWHFTSLVFDSCDSLGLATTDPEQIDDRFWHLAVIARQR